MDAMTFAASRLAAQRAAELDREIALRAARKRRATQSASSPRTTAPQSSGFALAGPSS